MGSTAGFWSIPSFMTAERRASGSGSVSVIEVQGVLDGRSQPHVGIDRVEIVGEEGLRLAGGVLEVIARIDADRLASCRRRPGRPRAAREFSVPASESMR